MKRIINWALILLMLQFFAIMTGCLDSKNNDIVTMNAREFWNDHTFSEDNETLIYQTILKSLDTGDTLIIKDIINNMTYRAIENYTLIECKSLLGQPAPFPIKGDITDEYWIGDKIMLTLTIITVTTTRQMYGETWIWEMETIRERWDSNNNSIAPIPRQYINRVT
jgi:hypothetical protein